MRKSVKSPSFKSSEVCGKGENRLGVDLSFLDRDFCRSHCTLTLCGVSG